MDMQASREFLAELKVLTHVHHLNLVIPPFVFTSYGGRLLLLLFSPHSLCGYIFCVVVLPIDV